MVEFSEAVSPIQSLEVISVVGTDLSLNLSPKSVAPGGAYTYSGRLTRRDTGAGVGGVTIECQRYEAGSWGLIASITTGADGSFAVNAVAPMAEGSYDCRAFFAGTVSLGGTRRMREMRVAGFSGGLESLTQLLLY